MDSRPQRTWFLLSDHWLSGSIVSGERYCKIQKMLNHRTENHSLIAKILLVHTPITFGHSQLIMNFPCDAQPDESARFHLASSIIQGALSALKKVLTETTRKEFEELAALTLTDGSYIKTLILRASADEDGFTYKVHLVPYFESHAQACQKRFTAIHSVDRNEKGGLLGWLGLRETIVDNWQLKNDNPFKCDLDKIAIYNLKLSLLAELLAEA